MQFRCPNCNHPIRVEGSASASADDDTIDLIECPSCHSKFGLSGDTEDTIVPEEGFKVGQLEVKELLGEGSYGTVFKAWDPELSRFVALKIPRAGRVTSKTSNLFLREARSAAAIHHSNVVSVYEVGMHDGQYYIVSQFIDGVTLAEWLKHHRMEPRDVAKMLIDILRGVQVFHDKKVVHRDLKPGNILIDKEMNPYVTDFGLARSEAPTELTVTDSGRIIGTLHYMAPEQARGEGRDVTAQSDIYAMGVVLYEMIAGRKPYKSSSSRTLLYSILTSDPLAPRRANPSVPRDLETICLKAMDKDKSRRYESAGQMADDLQRYLDGKPILATPPSVATRITKWVKRHTALTLALMVALVAVTIAVASSLREKIPSNAVAVVIETDPPSRDIRFTLFNQALRVPHASGFEETLESGRAAYLVPGFYRVSARTADGHFHEVWRTVPEAHVEQPEEPRFRHTFFEKTGTRQFTLPMFELFTDAELTVAFATIPGGEFDAGIQLNPRDKDGQHRQAVAALSVGLEEVSTARFRTIMDRPTHMTSNKKTYLEIFNEQFRDCSDAPGDTPVTGYPVGVAILYCELVGGRLPTHIEYEYVATQGGRAKFPTGEMPAVASGDEWKILPVDSSQSTTSPAGIINLYNSAAEFTDSINASYLLLYPDLFDVESLGTSLGQNSDGMLGGFAPPQEVRGAPPLWTVGGVEDPTRDVRQRISVPPSLLGPTTVQSALDKIGWRVYRTAAPR